jgi:hypothetical protein
VLAAGEGAVLSHQSAASLWGLVGPLLLPVHVTAPTHRTSRPGLRIHRSRSLTEDEITTRNRIPVTTPLRTIRDLPPHLKPAARREAIVTRLIDRTPTDTPTRSNPERRFLRRIRALALPEPECNVAVEGRERDFAWRALRVVVEVDGPHHEDPDVRRFDRARDRELVAAGWTVLRYADDDLDDLTELVALLG